ncbi:dihydroxyacetone kinase subunit DhaK [Streptomyces sp. NPDC051018]|uniref:dihydroxyacetone kinase subunit DhaK n=1 Tax=Streptomyces sp. NPDC051018 TaxID=3365639 RepID=UPI0037972B85
MKKLINRREDFVDEVIDAITRAHDEIRVGKDSDRVIVRSQRPERPQVGIVTGGGSGHLPLFLGYVGSGLCTAAAVGNVFSSPSSEQILSATKEADSGAGVLYLYGNYGGDVLNFDLAAEEGTAEGIDIRTVVIGDDVLSAPASAAGTRRGIAGMVMVYKAAGAAADRGDDLAAVEEIARRAAAAMRSAGVGLAPTILPTTGKPTFTLGETEMEIGVGIHGEPGSDRIDIESADATARRLMAPITEELELGAGDRVALLVNGLGATPAEELYLVGETARELLEERGVTIVHRWTGEYATSMEMAGASISVMKLDGDLEKLLAAPSHSPLVRF